MDASLIEIQLKHYLGDDINFYRYDTQNKRTPMTFVIAEAESELKNSIPVYWVDGGYPDIFNLSAQSKDEGVIVFSTRHLFTVAHIRQLFVNSIFSEDILKDLAERLTLQITAELALRVGNADFACLAFAKSLIGKGIFIPWGLDEEADLLTLEHELINEAYMTTWFYGLLHEYGHFFDGLDNYDNNPLLSKEAILKTANVVLEKLPYPEELKQLVFDKVSSNDKILGLEHLREEIIADVFGLGALLRSTYEIMNEIGGEEFDIFQFTQEMYTSTSITFLINTCKRVAEQGIMDGEVPEAQALKNIYLPVALNIRFNVMKNFLKIAVATFLGGDNPTEELIIKVDEAIDESIASSNELNSILESGWSKVLKFALFSDNRVEEGDLLMKNLALEFQGNNDGMVKIELANFCKKLLALEKEGLIVEQLLKINAMAQNS